MSRRTTEVRYTRRLLGLSALLLAGSARADVDGPGLVMHGMTDVQYAYSDSEQSWLKRGPDKLRFDQDDNDTLQLGRLGIELGYVFNLQSELKLAGHYYQDPDSSAEVTEAYWQFKSFGAGKWRSRYRVGAFYPPFSLENTGKLWTSPYTVSSSAINTWIGEEMRTIGLEGKWTWADDPYNRSKHSFSLFASLFGNNDTLGAMISWRGWSIHDRQTGLNGTLPLRELPIVIYADHSREFEPFMEMDDRPGFYVGGEWRYDRRWQLQLAYYDNRADDTIRQNDQYGWRTRFAQIALHWRGDNGYELLSQYMRGNTIMVVDTVDNDFESAYLMGVKSWGPHRLALRVELFRVIDLDGHFFDLNAEDGDSQTISYSYLFRKRWKLSLEGTRFFSDYRARSHFAERERRTENLLLASLRLYF